MTTAKRPFDWASTRDGFKQEYLGTLDERVDRYLAVRSLPFTPNHPTFSRVSSECRLLFRDGYFFACISSCQSVAEALSRMLCDRSRIRRRGTHNTRVARLEKESVISSSSRVAFDTIHSRRDDFHHLNPSVPSDRRELERLAKQCLKALASIEKEVFAFSKSRAGISPKYPQFWPSPAA